MSIKHEVGQRLAVHRRGGAYLGLGTVLQDGEIFLDSGKKILIRECRVTTTKGGFTPFEITLAQDTRVFTHEHGGLAFRGLWLEAGRKVGIELLKVQPWDHDDALAARFTEQESRIRYWLLISELELPFENGSAGRGSALRPGESRRIQ
ncbi:MAG TPA: hypothetical protein VHD37_00470 [Candidatus Paceibacterota bacterium]|nr:hypothetical protein [Candidatus Paceibacterota bacterium]